jgi:F0F1-type ATP synthase membrane subunit b/b'
MMNADIALTLSFCVGCLFFGKKGAHALVLFMQDQQKKAVSAVRQAEHNLNHAQSMVDHAVQEGEEMANQAKEMMETYRVTCAETVARYVKEQQLMQDRYGALHQRAVDRMVSDHKQKLALHMIRDMKQWIHNHDTGNEGAMSVVVSALRSGTHV